MFTALAQGARTWLLILRGIRRFNAAEGLWHFMLVVVEAAVLGALVGAAMGWVLGFAWERWHRRRRARRSPA
jgi:membrane protein YqaA with SNARE-associated domain